jgi:hypothetical protein
MKIQVTINDKRRSAKEPFPDAGHLVCEGSCPLCKAEPLKVAGLAGGKRYESRDTIACNAYCLGCKEQVGTIRVVVSTIFGIEEDERVLNGPWKVY